MIFLYSSNNTSVEIGDKTIYSEVMLEEGDKKNSYTPYGTTPIKMRGIGTYEDYFVRNSGNNLLDISKLVNGYWYNNGNLMANANWSYVNQMIEVEPNTAYTLSRSSSASGGSQFGIEEFDENGNFVKHNAQWQGAGIHSYTITTQPTTKYVYCQWETTYSYSDLMFEKGSSRTIYEPYGTGQWCKYNAIGSITLDGSEDWSLNQTKTYVNQYLSSSSLSDNIATGTSYIMSDYFKYKQADPTDTTNEDYMWLFQKRLVLDIRKTIVVDTTALKTWVGTNRPTFCFRLDTPYLEPITNNTLKSQLDIIEKALSKDGQTNISQINNDAPFKIYASALMKISGE